MASVASGIFGAQVTAVPGLDGVAIDEHELLAHEQAERPQAPDQLGVILLVVFDELGVGEFRLTGQ